MSTGAVLLRRSAVAVVERAAHHARSTRKAISRFAPRPQAFSLPSDAESAAVRAVRNISSFRLHYAVLLWLLLLASLFRHHRASMLFLMAASKALLFYGVLLRAFPNSNLLRRLLDRRLVLAFFLLLVVAELAVTNAIWNLLTALGFGVPVVLLHAVFRVRDESLVSEESGGAVGNGVDMDSSEKEKEEGDLESGGSSR
ncbi:PRA1 family protein F3-like [Typha latifolia]|uniref:PRA1 family protein F3-like n=1 Tax=Typha latifolia TaxID=4733 RepID=UPI003C2BACF9